MVYLLFGRTCPVFIILEACYDLFLRRYHLHVDTPYTPDLLGRVLVTTRV